MNLDILKKRVEDLIRQEKNRAHIVMAEKEDMQAIHEIAGPLIDIIIQLVRGVVEIYERSGISVKRLSEYDPGETVDKLADFDMMISMLDGLNKLRYVELATRLSVIDPDLVAQTFRELASLPDGKDKIVMIKAAIKLVEDEVIPPIALEEIVQMAEQLKAKHGNG